MGITAEMLPHIFESFRQAGGAPSNTGLGLGLSIARTLAESHGGWISADSEGEGRGSTFIIMLPLMRTVESKTLVATSLNSDPHQEAIGTAPAESWERGRPVRTACAARICQRFGREICLN